MATRMQQRRGTAAQWISTNSGNGPILNPGEIGFETDTNRFKIGDGTNHWINLDYFIDANSTVNPSFGSSITFEGATANDFETTLSVTDPTADRTITFPDATGTVALTSDIAELSQDAIDTALTAGTGITKTYNDGANTLTLAVDTTTIQARVADVSDTEIGYLNGVTSAIQTQLNALAPKADPTFTGTVSAASLTLSGDLTVNGTTTNINSTNLVVEDKNIVLGDATTPTDTTADGGGITLKGTTDKTFNWVDATDSWTSSEHINLASGKSLKLNGTDLKDVSETLTNKTINLASNTVSGTLAEFNTAVSNADLASIAGAETLTNKTLTSPVINTPTGITKSDVGLANVDNTTDANKPVSTATQTALDLKANLSSPELTGNPTAPTQTLGNDSTRIATTAFVKAAIQDISTLNLILDGGTP